MAKLSIPIDDELDKRLERLLPWGTKSAVFRAVTIALVEQLEKEGGSIIDLIIKGQYKPLPKSSTGD